MQAGRCVVKECIGRQQDGEMRVVMRAAAWAAEAGSANTRAQMPPHPGRPRLSPRRPHHYHCARASHDAGAQHKPDAYEDERDHAVEHQALPQTPTEQRVIAYSPM